MDLELLKSHAKGRWPEIIRAICGRELHFDPRFGGPCPMCPDGGHDRFGFFPDESGGCHCRVCTPKCGDGFATIQWLNNTGFAETKRAVENYLGFASSAPPEKKTKSPAFVRIDWIDSLAQMYAVRKGIHVASLAAVGAYFARHCSKPVIVIPIWGPKGLECGQIMLSPDDAGILYRGEKFDKKVMSKSQAGLCLELNKLRSATRVLKVEGPTDMLAAIGWFDGCVITNSNGAMENPKDWILDMLAGKEVFIIGDADVPGKNGAIKWYKALTKRNQKASLLQLPYPLEATKGKDLRDWLHENPGKSIEDIPLAPESGAIVVKKIDDPSRLAELNIDNYEAAHKRSIRFWRGEWWKWDGIKYRRIQEHELSAKVRASIQQEFESFFINGDHEEKEARPVTKNIVSNTIDAMASMRIIPDSREMPCWIDKDGPANIFTCQNGLVDVDAYLEGNTHDCLIPATQHWFSATSADYDFDPDADCPAWIDFLREVLPNPQTRSMVQEFAGYCLLPQTWLQKGLILFGTGGNGKSSFEAGLRALLGDANCSKAALESFGEQFSLQTMIGKLVNISHEFKNTDDLAEGLVKAIISGDPIECSRKYLSAVEFIPTTRIIIATNELPRFKDKSDGTNRRWEVIPFTKRFDNTSERKFGLDRIEAWLPEAPGMLNWALHGLKRLRATGKFTISEEVLASNQEFKIESNPTYVFLSDQFASHSDGYIFCREAYRLYREWCNLNGYYPMNNSHFGRELSQMFPGVRRAKRNDQFGQRHWAYEGIFWALADGSDGRAY